MLETIAVLLHKLFWFIGAEKSRKKVSTVVASEEIKNDSDSQ